MMPAVTRAPRTYPARRACQCEAPPRKRVVLQMRAAGTEWYPPRSYSFPTRSGQRADSLSALVGTGGDASGTPFCRTTYASIA